MQVALQGVAQEVLWTPTQTDRVTGTCRQTAPNSDRPDLWSQTWTDGDMATLMGRTPQPPGQSHRWMLLQEGERT